MMQGFALRCVATGSAYKMIWMTMQRRNRNFFLFLMFKSFCMHFWSQRNAAQILASYYKPAFTVSRLISTKINVGIYHYVIDTISAAVLCKFSYKMTYLSCLHFVQFHYFLSPSRCLPLFLNLSSLYKSFLLPTTLSSSLSPQMTQFSVLYIHRSIDWSVRIATYLWTVMSLEWDTCTSGHFVVKKWREVTEYHSLVEN